MLGLKIDSDCENMYDKPLGEIAKVIITFDLELSQY